MKPSHREKKATSKAAVNLWKKESKSVSRGNNIDPNLFLLNGRPLHKVWDFKVKEAEFQFKIFDKLDSVDKAYNYTPPEKTYKATQNPTFPTSAEQMEKHKESMTKGSKRVPVTRLESVDMHLRPPNGVYKTTINQPVKIQHIFHDVTIQKYRPVNPRTDKPFDFMPQGTM